MSRARGGHRREELDPIEREKLLAALKHARDGLRSAENRLRPFGSVYHACSSVVAAVDMLGYRLTGIPHYFELGKVAPGPPIDDEELPN